MAKTITFTLADEDSTLSEPEVREIIDSAMFEGKPKITVGTGHLLAAMVFQIERDYRVEDADDVLISTSEVAEELQALLAAEPDLSASGLIKRWQGRTS